MTEHVEIGSEVLYERSFNLEDETDIGNALHFAWLNRSRLLYCKEWKTWLIWDGKRWGADRLGKVTNFAKEVTKDMFRIAHEMDSMRARMFASTTSNKPRLKAMIDLAESELPIGSCGLDADQWLLNCPNGTLNLKTGDLLEHDPNQRITKLCATAYDQDAQAPRWEKFLSEVFPDDPKVPEFLARWFGYCLTGSVREEMFPIFVGDGANGKSTMLTAILEATGNDYAIQANPDMLMESKKSSHPTDKTDLCGIRLAMCAESESTQTLAAATIKALTGGDKIRARRMKENFWEFQPTHKLVLATNYTPIIKDSSHGIARRLAIVKFNQRFDGRNRDNGLKEKLRSEYAGILAWMVRGCMEWQQVGIRKPRAVELATNTYLREQDVVGRFFSERCSQQSIGKVHLKHLVEASRDWCSLNSESFGQKDLTTWLAQHGYEKRMSDGTVFDGLVLKPNDLSSLEAPEPPEAVFTLTQSS